MKTQNATALHVKQGQAAETSNATAAGMTKKREKQRGHQGGRMESMPKAMGQKSRGENRPQMERMMGMWSEMITSVRQTNALAVHATAELQQVFGEWLKDLDGKALRVFAKGPADAAAIARSLKITEASALYLLGRLAAGSKITLLGKLKRS
jgi:hypothetical protein